MGKEMVINLDAGKLKAVSEKVFQMYADAIERIAYNQVILTLSAASSRPLRLEFDERESVADSLDSDRETATTLLQLVLILDRDETIKVRSEAEKVGKASAKEIWKRRASMMKV